MKTFQIKGKVLIDQDKLDLIILQAKEYADMVCGDLNDDYWTILFKDKLAELLNNKDFYTLECVDEEVK